MQNCRAKDYFLIVNLFNQTINQGIKKQIYQCNQIYYQNINNIPYLDAKMC